MFEFEWNTIEMVCTATAWAILCFWIIHMYKKHDPEKRPKKRKIVVIFLVGLFSVSIDLPVFGEMISIAILPIGLAVAYTVLNRSRRWEVYSRYAWSGFAANYLFMVTTLVAAFLSSQLYPEGEIETYLDDVSGAELITIHPSAKESEFNAEQFEEDVSGFELEDADVIGWYEEVMEQEQDLETNERNQIKEKFPYLITGIESKEGDSVPVYLEADGKGMLLNTKENQYYYRSESASFLKEGVSEE